MDKKLVFGIKEGEEVIYLTLAKKKINVPPFGVLTADEVMKREDVLRHLVASRKTFPVLRELDPEEVEEYNAVEKTAEDLAKEADEAKKALESAQAEYEELTGKKAGNMKLETLLKKIEEANAKKD